MEHTLIQKIDSEQKELEIKTITSACHALGFSKESQWDIIRHYEWLLTLRVIQKGMKITEHMIKQHTHAEKNYLTSLERAIAKHPLKLSDWKRAGQAMERIFKKFHNKTH